MIEPEEKEVSISNTNEAPSNGGQWKLSIPWLPWLLPALLFVVPTAQFLIIALARFSYPFELEWLEGEVALYSVRWQEERSIFYLYPPYENGSYCPHLYPPIFQIISAELHSLFGGNLLGVGRMVSILSTFGIMLSVFLIVKDATRNKWAALIGALSYLTFFKVGGYWYDLYRVDSLAYAFAMFSTWLILRKRGALPSVLLGFFFALLAHFTKQTAAYIPLLALFWRLFQCALAYIAKGTESRGLGPRGTEVYKDPVKITIAFAVIALITLNGYYFLREMEDSSILYYLYEVPSHHHIYFDKIQNEGYQSLWQYYIFAIWLLPLGLWSAAFLRKWSPRWLVFPLAIVSFIISYALGKAFESGLLEKTFPMGADPSLTDPSTVIYVLSTWPVSMKWALAFTLGGSLALLFRWILYRTISRGFVWFLILFAAQYVAAVTWVKIGGYINNFFSLFVVQSVVLGICVSWTMRSMKASMGQAGKYLAAVLVSTVFVFTWYGTKEFTLLQDPSQDWAKRAIITQQPVQIAELPWYASDGLRYHRPPFTLKARNDEGEEVSVTIDHGNVLGDQLPPEETFEELVDSDIEYGEELLENIQFHHENGGVYMPHHNYLKYLATGEYDVSADALRDVQYLGRRTPDPLIKDLKSGKYKYVVTMMKLQYEWFPGDMKNVISTHYELIWPIVEDVPQNAYRPVTGVQMRPEWVYRYKGVD